MDKIRSLNILFILPEYYPHSGGGISTYYIHHIKALTQTPGNVKVKVIVGSGYTQAVDSFVIDEVEIEYLKPDLYAKYLSQFSKFDLMPEFKRNLAAAWAMFEQANYGEGFDIIECTDFALGFIPWVIDHQKPVLTRMHGSTGQITLHEQDLDDPMQNDMIRQTELLLLPLCDCLITHSTANKSMWENLIRKEITHISPIYLASPAEKVAFNEREDYGLVTARIQIWKGPVKLCQAMSILGSNTLGVKWYGRDTLYLNNQKTSAFLQQEFPDIWEKRVLPQSPLTSDAISHLQKKAKFGLIASTWDMFNFTCIEFMAAGTPVICSDGAGVSELIIHKVNGFKYPAADVNALAKCLQEVSQLDENAYYAIAQAGADTISDRLSASKLIPRNVEQYEKTLTAFSRHKPNAFLNSIYLPSVKQHNIGDVLDKQPLKTIWRYLLKRARHKL